MTRMTPALTRMGPYTVPVQHSRHGPRSAATLIGLCVIGISRVAFPLGTKPPVGRTSPEIALRRFVRLTYAVGWNTSPAAEQGRGRASFPPGFSAHSRIYTPFAAAYLLQPITGFGLPLSRPEMYQSRAVAWVCNTVSMVVAVMIVR